MCFFGQHVEFHPFKKKSKRGRDFLKKVETSGIIDQYLLFSQRGENTAEKRYSGFHKPLKNCKKKSYLNISNMKIKK